jgi:hypothetical protein
VRDLEVPDRGLFNLLLRRKSRSHLLDSHALADRCTAGSGPVYRHEPEARPTSLGFDRASADVTRLAALLDRILAIKEVEMLKKIRISKWWKLAVLFLLCF